MKEEREGREGQMNAVKGVEGKASYTTTFLPNVQQIIPRRTSQYFTNPIKNPKTDNTVSSVFSDIGYSDSVIRLLLTVTLFQIPIN